MPPFFIYALKDPRTDEIRYIGQTSVGMARPLAHALPSTLKRRPAHFRNWVNSMKVSGCTYTVHVLEEFLNPEPLNGAEMRWIAFLRSQGARLINYTDGGGGIRGFHLPEKARQKIADSNHRRKGEKRNFTPSEAQIAAVRAAQPKAAAARRGIRPSEAAIEALTKFARSPRSPEHRAHIAAALRNKKKSAEHVRNSILAKQRNRQMLASTGK